ncbi:uncharacterized protein LOC114719361 [Neltuma alba]|nr:uncharacterized protein LOC114719361 [Prosopis alba]
MGLEISSQQLYSRRKTAIRLWRHEDIYDFFISDKGTEAIRCMSLDASKIKRITLRANNFRKMHNLIFLKVYKSDHRKPSKLNICEDMDYLPEELRFVSWEEYPLPYVPLHFCAENLLTLEMRNSNIRQLWGENQHFPNLKQINLSDSKNLSALPDLSQAPKIEVMDLEGCVNLRLIHSSTALEKNVRLGIDDSGPVQINFGGSIKGTSSGLVIVYNYLDLPSLSFHKVTMKLFVCGKIISGVRYKHVVMPLAEIAELRMGIRSVASLLPFVRKLEWLESPIEYGDDFKQHHAYDVAYSSRYNLFAPDFSLYLKLRGDRGERGVMMGPLRRKMITDNGYIVIATTLMEDEEEDDDGNELMEYGCHISAIRVPNNITRWSLLTRLTLKESDIIIGNNNADCSIPQLSILKSLIALSHDSCRRTIQPHLDVKLSLRDDHSFFVLYNCWEMTPQHPYTYPYNHWFSCRSNNFRSNHNSDYCDLIVDFGEWW